MRAKAQSARNGDTEAQKKSPPKHKPPISGKFESGPSRLCNKVAIHARGYSRSVHHQFRMRPAERLYNKTVPADWKMRERGRVRWTSFHLLQNDESRLKIERSIALQSFFAIILIHNLSLPPEQLWES